MSFLDFPLKKAVTVASFIQYIYTEAHLSDKLPHRFGKYSVGSWFGKFPHSFGILRLVGLGSMGGLKTI